MKKYCKYYTLGEMRTFPGWAAGASPGEREMADDEPVFLRDDFTVLASPVDVDNGERLFAEDTPEWREFCTAVLNFEIPEELTITLDLERRVASATLRPIVPRVHEKGWESAGEPGEAATEEQTQDVGWMYR